MHVLDFKSVNSFMSSPGLFTEKKLNKYVYKYETLLKVQAGVYC